MADWLLGVCAEGGSVMHVDDFDELGVITFRPDNGDAAEVTSYLMSCPRCGGVITWELMSQHVAWHVVIEDES